jgi:sugar phosphate isomerase/epimerase
MNRVALSELSTMRWSLEEDVMAYAAAGFGGIGVWRQKLDEYGEEKGAELIREHGLTVSSLQWCGGFTGTEPHSYEEAIADSLLAIEQAHAINANCLIMHGGGQGGHIQKHLSRILRGAIETILPRAIELNVRLAIEPMHPQMAGNWTTFCCYESALRTVREFDSPHLGLVFDTFHMARTTESLALLKDSLNEVFLVQIADSFPLESPDLVRLLPGHGVLPIHEVLRTLDQAHFGGFVELDLMGHGISQGDYSDFLQMTRIAMQQVQLPEFA